MAPRIRRPSAHTPDDDCTKKFVKSFFHRWAKRRIVAPPGKAFLMHFRKSA